MQSARQPTPSIEQKRLNAVKYMRVLLDAQPHMTCVIDPRENDIIDGNQRFLVRFGYINLDEFAELVQSVHLVRADGTDKESNLLQNRDWIKKVLRKKRGRYRLTIPIDGESRRFDLHVASALYQSGVDDATYQEANYLVMSLVEMSEQVRLHKKLLRLNKKLQKRMDEEVEKRMKSESMLLQQSKMAEMGNMIGAISHQLKQPLSIMRGITMYVQDTQEFEPEALTAQALQEQMDRVNEQVDYMNETINLFRNFFRPDRKLSCFNPVEMIENTYKLLHKQLENRGVKVEFELCDCRLHGYANEFMQVMLNLLNNARDAIESTRKTGSSEESGKVTITMETKNNHCEIRVEDNGGGIPDTLLPDELFESYVTTKGEAGTGIGLSICKFIIEQHFKGSITAGNHQQGARFTLRLPIAKKASCQ